MTKPRLCPYCKNGTLLFHLPISGMTKDRICNNCGFVESQAAISTALTPTHTLGEPNDPEAD